MNTRSHDLMQFRSRFKGDAITQRLISNIIEQTRNLASETDPRPRENLKRSMEFSLRGLEARLRGAIQ